MKTNETSKKENLILIDPPSGWKYGFPKVVTQEQYKSIKDLKQWCIDNGYSREEAKSYGDYFHIQLSGDLSFMSEVNETSEIPAMGFKIPNKPNQKEFEIGDEVVCLKSALFTDNTRHIAGQTYKVTKENLDYFIVCKKDYQLKTNQKQFKQFDESLFKAYIDKFSDEDKLKAIKVLMKATNIDICTSNGFIYR